MGIQHLWAHVKSYLECTIKWKVYLWVTTVIILFDTTVALSSLMDASIMFWPGLTCSAAYLWNMCLTKFTNRSHRSVCKTKTYKRENFPICQKFCETHELSGLLACVLVFYRLQRPIAIDGVLHLAFCAKCALVSHSFVVFSHDKSLIQFAYPFILCTSYVCWWAAKIRPVWLTSPTNATVACKLKCKSTNRKCSNPPPNVAHTVTMHTLTPAHAAHPTATPTPEPEKPPGVPWMVVYQHTTYEMPEPIHSSRWRLFDRDAQG